MVEIVLGSGLSFAEQDTQHPTRKYWPGKMWHNSRPFQQGRAVV